MLGADKGYTGEKRLRTPGIMYPTLMHFYLPDIKAKLSSPSLQNFEAFAMNEQKHTCKTSKKLC